MVAWPEQIDGLKQGKLVAAHNEGVPATHGSEKRAADVMDKDGEVDPIEGTRQKRRKAEQDAGLQEDWKYHQVRPTRRADDVKVKQEPEPEPNLSAEDAPRALSPQLLRAQTATDGGAIGSDDKGNRLENPAKWTTGTYAQGKDDHEHSQI